MNLFSLKRGVVICIASFCLMLFISVLVYVFRGSVPEIFYRLIALSIGIGILTFIHFWSGDNHEVEPFRGVLFTLLKIEFIINSEVGMPFMLGYHLAFLLSNSGKESLETKKQCISLEDVYNAGSKAFPVLNSNKITLKNINKKDLEISTKGFENFMLWTEVNNMLCIEPITQYTSYTDQQFSEENMRLSQGKEFFEVQIKIL